MRAKINGFTLIELLIALSIMGILAAITYPSYAEQMARSRRAEAQGALVSFANAMEMWRMQHEITGYLQAAGTQGAPTDIGSPQSALFPAVVPLSGGTTTYNLTISAATASTYTLTATPVANDTCAALTIDNTGVKTPLTVTDGNGATINCW
ncbi:type IV pilin protein [Crenothrix sp.]|uniref:type IV pilin protein n=1 Tax=Crenothrix sp. TaxID=3100433 RepID=UPI00374D96FB